MGVLGSTVKKATARMAGQCLAPMSQPGAARSFREVLLPSTVLKNLGYSLWGRYSTVFSTPGEMGKGNIRCVYGVQSARIRPYFTPNTLFSSHRTEKPTSKQP